MIFKRGIRSVNNSLISSKVTSSYLFPPWGPHHVPINLFSRNRLDRPSRTVTPHPFIRLFWVELGTRVFSLGMPDKLYGPT